MNQSTPPNDTDNLGKLLQSLETQTGSFGTRAGRIKAIALLSGYKLSSPTPLGEMARLLAGVKLPKPLELAKLALSVGLHDKPDEAIRTALRFYLRATLFHKKHQNDALADLALAAGDYDIFLGADTVQRLREPLRLEMDKRNDAVRRYLKKHGCNLKKAKSVKENLRDWCKHTDMLLFLALTKKLSLAVHDSMTEKEKNEAREQQARKAGWNKSDTELFAPFRESWPDNREVYLVPQAVLDSIVERKKTIKQSPWIIKRHANAELQAKESSQPSPKSGQKTTAKKSSKTS